MSENLGRDGHEPALAAHGPTLLVGSPGDGPGTAGGWLPGPIGAVFGSFSRVGQAVITSLFGLMLVLVPVVVVSMAAAEAQDTVSHDTVYQAPGVGPVWVGPGTVLPTAHR